MSGREALCVRRHAFVLLRNVGLAALLWLAGSARPVLAASVTFPEPGRVSAADEDELARKPVPLALELGYEGLPPATLPPLRVKAGQTFFINQIDLREVKASANKPGTQGLTEGWKGFAGLDWAGVAQVDAESVLLANGEGTFTRRHFFRGARWMEQASTFTVQPMDERERPTGAPMRLNIGRGDRHLDTDDFFVRRLRAVRTLGDCAGPRDCASAKKVSDEVLVELRNARTGALPFTLPANARALRITWTMLPPGAFFTLPLQQEERPAYAYGASVDIKVLTPPRFNGTYASGTKITFQLTVRDGTGKRLHPEGRLPTYNEFASGQVDSGLQYYRAFAEPTTTYYLRKHRERMMMTQIIGPLQKVQPIRSILSMEDFLLNDVQTPGTLERDGVFSQVQTIPSGPKLFGGAFDPAHAGWDAPVSDTWTYTLPRNAAPGTYLVTVKGRRVYMGEDIPFSHNISIQVDTPRPSEAQLTTGPCTSCHTEGGELSKVLHANDNRAACNGCHAPLGFELEGPI
ncbi:MAG: cytochrome C, partial [Cystobacter sp.]